MSLGRCWFETDEEFQSRCAYEKEQGIAKFTATRKKMGGSKKTSTAAGVKSVGTQGRIATKGSSSAGQWATIGQKKVVSGSKASSRAATGPRAGGFAAAFGGDDSSDEDS